MNQQDNITVRYATTEDLETSHAFDPAVPKHRLKRKIEEKEVILASLNTNEIAGYLRFEYLWSKRPFIGSIEVKPNAQRNGIGTTMLNWFIQQMQQAKHQTIYSSTMFDNQLSQNWHRKNNFHECGAMTGINRDGIGELFFSRSIQPTTK